MSADPRITYFDSPIVLTGELTPSDVLTALRVRERSRRRYLLALVAAAFFFLFFVMIGLTIRPHLRESGDRVLLLSLVGPLMIVFPILWRRYRIHREWKYKRGTFAKVETTISNEGFSFRRPNVQSQIAWDHFTGFRRTEDVAVLFFPGGWILVARSRFPDLASWNHFLGFIDRYFQGR